MIAQPQDQVLGVISKAPPKDIQPAHMLRISLDPNTHG